MQCSGAVRPLVGTVLPPPQLPGLQVPSQNQRFSALISPRPKAAFAGQEGWGGGNPVYPEIQDILSLPKVGELPWELLSCLGTSSGCF